MSSDKFSKLTAFKSFKQVVHHANWANISSCLVFYLCLPTNFWYPRPAGKNPWFSPSFRTTFQQELPLLKDILVICQTHQLSWVIISQHISVLPSLCYLEKKNKTNIYQENLPNKQNKTKSAQKSGTAVSSKHVLYLPLMLQPTKRSAPTVAQKDSWPSSDGANWCSPQAS